MLYSDPQFLSVIVAQNVQYPYLLLEAFSFPAIGTFSVFFRLLSILVNQPPLVVCPSSFWYSTKMLLTLFQEMKIDCQDIALFFYLIPRKYGK